MRHSLAFTDPEDHIIAARKDLELYRGAQKKTTKPPAEFYFNARLKLANAQNLQRIADSLEQLFKLLKNQPVIVAADPVNLNITGAGQPVCDCGADARTSFGSDHAETCPMWAPF